MIGLCDLDLLNYGHTAFNIDLMKLSAYYKKRKEVVTLIDDYSATGIKKIFCAQDYPSENPMPDVAQYNNVSLIGRALSPTMQRIPLKEEIEEMVPDTSLYAFAYDWFKKQTSVTDLGIQRDFRSQLRANHFLLSLDNGKTLWPNWKKQLRVQDKRGLIFMCHDMEPMKIPGAREALIEFFKGREGNSYFACKWPIHLKNEQELTDLHEIPLSFYCPLDFKEQPSDQFFYDYVLLKGSDAFNQNYRWIALDITNGCDSEEDFLRYKARHVELLCIFLYKNNVKLLLKDEKEIIKSPEGKEYLKIIGLFTGINSATSFWDEHNKKERKDDTIFDFTNRLSERYERYAGLECNGLSKRLYEYLKPYPDLVNLAQRTNVNYDKLERRFE